MKKLPILIFLLLFCAAANSQEYLESENGAYRFPLKWKTKIGVSTFRTTMSYSNGMVIVGSNGESRSSLLDPMDGVYVINGKTGKVVKHIKPNKKGDTDVNGVAIYNNNIFFGDDESWVYSYTIQGNKRWEFRADGDIEGAPALTDVQGDGYPDVILATESGSVFAIDGSNGKKIWSTTIGKDESDKKYEWLASKAFIASPAIYDINDDGVRDVLIGSRNASFYAFDGSSGEVIWRYDVYSGIHSSAMIMAEGDNLRILFAESY